MYESLIRLLAAIGRAAAKLPFPITGLTAALLAGLMLARPKKLWKPLLALALSLAVLWLPLYANKPYAVSRTAADETRVQNGGIRLLYVGTLVPRKKALTVAKAVEIMNRNGMHIQLTVVGKPIDMDILNALKCSPDVIYHAACPKEELIRFYRENDIFVMPSRDETFGLVYAEAMSQGLPVIYGVGEGFDGQFPDGTVGFPAEPDSP